MGALRNTLDQDSTAFIHEAGACCSLLKFIEKKKPVAFPSRLDYALLFLYNKDRVKNLLKLENSGWL